MTFSDGAGMDAASTAHASFERLCSEADPREYYRVLGGLNYVIPDLAKDIFRNLIAALEERKGRPITVLDVGCGYGSNAALIRYPLDLRRLQQRYVDLQVADIPTSELIALDRNFFRSWPRHEVKIIGCDVSRSAISYARLVGLIDGGLTQNLEEEPLMEVNKDMLRGVDLIISTGAIGHVTERTLARLLSAIGEPAPWLASFVLRTFPYDRISGLMSELGLVTEKLAGVTFVQRRFQSETEFRHVLSQLDALDIDSRNKEAEGLLHSEFFLSRPAADRTEMPLETLVSVCAGICRPYGRRFRMSSDHVVRLSP